MSGSKKPGGNPPVKRKGRKVGRPPSVPNHPDSEKILVAIREGLGDSEISRRFSRRVAPLSRDAVRGMRLKVEAEARERAENARIKADQRSAELATLEGGPGAKEAAIVEELATSKEARVRDAVGLTRQLKALLDGAAKVKGTVDLRGAAALAGQILAGLDYVSKLAGDAPREPTISVLVALLERLPPDQFAQVRPIALLQDRIGRAAAELCERLPEHAAVIEAVFRAALAGDGSAAPAIEARGRVG